MCFGLLSWSVNAQAQTKINFQTQIGNFPSACANGQLTVGLGASLTCANPVGTYTVATLPAAGSINTNLVAVVTDGTSSGDCTTGGGTSRAFCQSNGTAWVPVIATAGIPYPSGSGLAIVASGTSWGTTLAEVNGDVAYGSGGAWTASNAPALSAANMTGFPTLNQTTTGDAGGLTGCTPSGAGALCYWTGSAWTGLNGNTTATHVLQETSAGVPSWAAVTGSPGGSSTQVQYNNAGAFGGITNLTSDGTNPFLTAIAAPATPSAGLGVLYVDSTSKVLSVKNDGGTVSHTVQTTDCGSDFAQKVNADGSVTCAAAGGGGATTAQQGQVQAGAIRIPGTTVVITNRVQAVSPAPFTLLTTVKTDNVQVNDFQAMYFQNGTEGTNPSCTAPTSSLGNSWTVNTPGSGQGWIFTSTATVAGNDVVTINADCSPATLGEAYETALYLDFGNSASGGEGYVNVADATPNPFTVTSTSPHELFVLFGSNGNSNQNGATYSQNLQMVPGSVQLFHMYGNPSIDSEAIAEDAAGTYTFNQHYDNGNWTRRTGFAVIPTNPVATATANHCQSASAAIATCAASAAVTTSQKIVAIVGPLSGTPACSATDQLGNVYTYEGGGVLVAPVTVAGTPTVTFSTCTWNGTEQAAVVFAISNTYNWAGFMDVDGSGLVVCSGTCTANTSAAQTPGQLILPFSVSSGAVTAATVGPDYATLVNYTTGPSVYLGETVYPEATSNTFTWSNSGGSFNMFEAPMFQLASQPVYPMTNRTLVASDTGDSAGIMSPTTIPSSPTSVNSPITSGYIFDGQLYDKWITPYGGLSANVTASFYRNMVDAKQYPFTICEPSSGGPWTFAWPSNSTNAPQVKLVAGACTHATGTWSTASQTMVFPYPAPDTLCIDPSASPSCGAATAGFVTIQPSATTATVTSTAIGANSVVTLNEDSSLGAALGVTCNTGVLSSPPEVTARTAGTSFVITTSAAPTTNPACYSFHIVNALASLPMGGYAISPMGTLAYYGVVPLETGTNGVALPTWHDHSGNNDTLTSATGATFTTNAINTSLPALVFPGTSAGRYSLASGINCQSKCTLIAVYKTPASTSGAVFFSGPYGAITFALTSAFHLYMDDSVHTITGTNTLTASTWYIAGWTYDNSTGNWTLYENGVLDASGTTSLSSLNQNETVFGYNAGPGSSDLVGSVAAVAIYPGLAMSSVQMIATMTKLNQYFAVY